MIIVVIIGIIIFLHVVLSGPSSPNTSQQGQPAASVPPIDVSARQLFNAYQANEVSADSAYKDRSLRVSGSIASINKDFTESVYLMLSTPNEFMNVRAELAKDEEAQAGNLSKGERIILVCRGNGMIIGSPVLKDCTIEQAGGR